MANKETVKTSYIEAEETARKYLARLKEPANGGTNLAGLCQALGNVDEDFKPAFSMRVESFLVK